ncbi:MAG TPA: FKBP-type peptidyl-prolyl cis-trans isomerase [Candidatus Thermoplasmatota archaeon]|nr:FKBP-type peptidyl-prolyl cis-trans isomerase [Candidatus Thermoplasmatota archaeon]
MRDLGLRVVAFLAFCLVIGGAVWASYEYLSVRAVDLATPDDAYAVSAGERFTVPYTLLNTGSAEELVTLRVEDDGGLGIEPAPATVLAPSFGQVAGFLDLDVPTTARPGEHQVAISAVGADGSGLGQLSLDVEVLAAGGGIRPGEGGMFAYVGRFEDGTVFDTNVREVGIGPWAKTPDYVAHDVWADFGMRAGPGSNVVVGLAQGILGMHEGESRTVTVAPDGGYGNATREDTIPRVVEIERDHRAPLQERGMPRRQFDQLITQSGQGDPATYEADEQFDVRDEFNSYKARIVSIDDQSVRYRFELTPGEKYTLYPFWPEGSEVAAVTSNQVTFRTTPTTEVGEMFTYFDPWTDLTAVVGLNATHVVLRHEVAPGFTYQHQANPQQPPTTFTVREVGDELILIDTPNPHPLGGKTLVFSVKMTARAAEPPPSG